MDRKKVNNFISQGRGQGEGAQYIPWIKVGDFSSLGRSY
jgi:NAD dependent epimerase/dehydratase family enzyme